MQGNVADVPVLLCEAACFVQVLCCLVCDAEKQKRSGVVCRVAVSRSWENLCVLVTGDWVLHQGRLLPAWYHLDFCLQRRSCTSVPELKHLGQPAVCPVISKDRLNFTSPSLCRLVSLRADSANNSEYCRHERKPR